MLIRPLTNDETGWIADAAIEGLGTVGTKNVNRS
jgi:hypothetical protein